MTLEEYEIFKKKEDEKRWENAKKKADKSIGITYYLHGEIKKV